MSTIKSVTEIIADKKWPSETNKEFARMRGEYIHRAMQEMAASNWRTIPAWVGQFSEEYVSLVRAAQAMCGLEPLMIEKDVKLIIPDLLEIRGRVDVVAVDMFDRRILIDYKTEARPVYKHQEDKQYHDWAVQLSLYAEALEREGEIIDELRIIHLPKRDSMTCKTLKRIPLHEIIGDETEKKEAGYLS